MLSFKCCLFGFEGEGLCTFKFINYIILKFLSQGFLSSGPQKFKSMRAEKVGAVFQEHVHDIVSQCQVHPKINSETIKILEVCSRHHLAVPSTSKKSTVKPSRY